MNASIAAMTSSLCHPLKFLRYPNVIESFQFSSLILYEKNLGNLNKAHDSIINHVYIELMPKI